MHKKSGGTVIQGFEYLLDKTGNRTKLTLDGGDYVEFLSDRQYQLTKETRKNSGGTLLYSNTFWYDNRGNRTKLDADDGSGMGQPVTTTYLYSLADALTKETTGGADTTYSYDASGNQTRKSVGGTNHDFHFDVRNLLTKYTDGTTTATYTIDVLARRAKKTIGSTVERYLYDGLNVLAEYDGAATPALQASYVVAGRDRYVSQTRGGSVYYFHQDPLGSVWNLTDSSEVVQNTYQYEAFGATYATVTENVTNPYRYTGRKWDSESSSHYYRLRLYDALLGRFRNSDPLRFDTWDANFFRYVRNRPTFFVDPFGTQEIIDDEGVLGGEKPNVGRPEPSEEANSPDGDLIDEIQDRDEHLAKAGEVANEVLDDLLNPPSVDDIQAAVEPIGMIPGFGEPVDGANAIIDLAQGQCGSAAANAACAVPFLDWIIKPFRWFKNLRAAKRAGKVDELNKLRNVGGGGKRPRRTADASKDAARKAVEEAKQAWKQIDKADKAIIHDVLNDKLPREAFDQLPEKTKDAAIRYFGTVSEYPLNSADAARQLNKARVDFLKGAIDQPPGGISNFQ